MRKTTILSAMVAAVLCVAVGATAADAPELKCPVSNKPATKDHAVAYKDGQVYFCCDNCPAAFKANTKKFATKANAQLVASGQYKEVKCPLTGKALNPETSVVVDGISVQFCCNGCKGKVEGAKGKKQLNLVFSEAAFKKGFEKVAASDKK
jgi:hypothetical protein